MTTEEELIEINLKNVEEGKPLTISLAVLNGAFKEEYRKKFGEFERLSNEEKKAYKKTDKYKAYQKAYKKTDKYKAYQKAYQKTDKYKAYQKTDKYKAYKKAYYQRKKGEGK